MVTEKRFFDKVVTISFRLQRKPEEKKKNLFKNSGPEETTPIPLEQSCLDHQVALVIKNPPASAGDIGDTGSIPGSGRSPGEGNGKPLQYSCLENPINRVTWWFIVHGVAKSWTRLKRLGKYAHLDHLSAAAAAAKSPQSCLTLCDPIDRSPPGSPVPGILQARTLEWVAISFSNA